MKNKTEVIKLYAALIKGDVFINKLYSSKAKFVKFNNAWARNAETNDWHAMTPTETVVMADIE